MIPAWVWLVCKFGVPDLRWPPQRLFDKGPIFQDRLSEICRRRLGENFQHPTAYWKIFLLTRASRFANEVVWRRTHVCHPCWTLAAGIRNGGTAWECDIDAILNRTCAISLEQIAGPLRDEKSDGCCLCDAVRCCSLTGIDAPQLALAVHLCERCASLNSWQSGTATLRQTALQSLPVVSRRAR